MNVEQTVGKSFGRLTVVDFIRKDPRGIRLICQCSCGQIREADKYKVVSGLTQSCGCLMRDTAKKVMTQNSKNPDFVDSKLARKRELAGRRRMIRHKMTRHKLSLRMTKAHFRMNINVARKKHGSRLSKSILRSCYNGARSHASWWAFNISNSSLYKLKP